MSTVSVRVKTASSKGLRTLLEKALKNNQVHLARIIMEELKTRPAGAK